ncbi:MAG: thiamine pyrophosphate-binding protein [Firmicutes bacterium]|nr:thiamine pyrophosphate-binding protein [Bacillota bacterium]MCL5038712.1 thiamine pyrophosphate-binding protein [Bacillota bacterium]
MKTGEKYNGGALVAEVLKREGAKYIFGVPGGHIYPLMEAGEERGIRFIGVRHEMNAAFMAEGWALTTGEFGVCTGTAGPGVTNLLTGLANSSNGGFPVLFLAGKARIAEFDRNELQDFNQIDMVKPVTKHARVILDAKRIPEYVGRAIAYCTTGRPGPVYLEIPRDILEVEVDAAQVEFQQFYRSTSAPVGNPDDVERAARMIESAQRPLIVAGGGVWWAQAQAELKSFVEKSRIPIFTRNAARGIISDAHPLAMGIAASASPVFRQAINQADLVIVIGTRTGYTLSREVLPKTLDIIRIDIDPAQLTDQLDVKLGIVGDARLVLRQLTEAVGTGDRSAWIQTLRGIKSGLLSLLMPMARSNQRPIHPLRLMSEIISHIDQDTIVVIDGGDAARWGNLMLPALRPGGYPGIISTSFGPLGVGVPYAMVARLAHPEKKVLLLTGDGAFGYGAMEYETAVRYNIPFTTVILNDKTWGMIKRSEAKRSSPDKKFIGLDLGEVRYDQIVEVLGGHGEFVTEPDQIGTAIDRALHSDKPACVNVMTDPNIGPVI